MGSGNGAVGVILHFYALQFYSDGFLRSRSRASVFKVGHYSYFLLIGL